MLASDEESDDEQGHADSGDDDEASVGTKRAPAPYDAPTLLKFILFRAMFEARCQCAGCFVCGC